MRPTRAVMLALAVTSMCLSAATASGPAAHVPAYNGFGFGAYAGGHLFALARSGIRHSDDPAGRVAWFGDAIPPQAGSAADSPAADDRNVAGGVTPSGRIVFFYTRYAQPATSLATEPDAVVAVRTSTPWSGTDERQESVAVACCSPDVLFSAYGPLVALPSGRLMQTFYGRNAAGSRCFVRFSDDDGRSWTGESQIDRDGSYAPSETAAAYVAGAGPDARLVAVSRSQSLVAGVWHHVLRQYVSFDAGSTWTNQGPIAISETSDVVTPWISSLSGGRLALVWADRGTRTLKVSVAAGPDALAGPGAWPPPREVYTSALAAVPGANPDGFGYPSIASSGTADAQKTIVFYDTRVAPQPAAPAIADVTAGRNVPADTQVFALPLTAVQGDIPQPLDPVAP